MPVPAKKEGVLVVDLAYIPEKYRLDVQRAEQILTESLSQWLRTYEGVVANWAMS